MSKSQPRAFFGLPQDGFVRGGTHITVYLVPVVDGGLVVFDVEARQARGRWLPWDVLDFGQNPYEAASALADQWCNLPLRDLSLVDVLSLPVEGGGWELAIVFRGELVGMPPGDPYRKPVRIEPGHFDAIGPFDPVDIERWVGTPAEPAAARPSEGLLF